MTLLTKKEKEVLDLIDSGVPVVCRNLEYITKEWEVFNLESTTTARDILYAMSSGWEYKAAPIEPEVSYRVCAEGCTTGYFSSMRGASAYALSLGDNYTPKITKFVEVIKEN